MNDYTFNIKSIIKNLKLILFMIFIETLYYLLYYLQYSMASVEHKQEEHHHHHGHHHGHHHEDHKPVQLIECEVHVSISLIGKKNDFITEWQAATTTVHLSLPEDFSGETIDNEVKRKLEAKLKDYIEEYSKEGFKPATLTASDKFTYKKMTTYVTSIKIFDKKKNKWNDLRPSMSCYELL